MLRPPAFEPAPPRTAHSRDAARAVGVALGVSGAVTLLSYVLPEEHAATAIGLAFLLATHLLVLRKNAETIRRHGLALGGLLEPQPLDFRRIARETARAFGVALLACAVVFPVFTLGWLWFWQPEAPFRPAFGRSLWDDGLGHLLVIALPEEAFFRGYLQTELETALPPKRKLFGAGFGLAIVLTSALFALGHVATELHVNRLAVFFPSLLFGWLRARTGGVGASVLFHAACNVFASFLAESYGLGA
jgi:membrane protease YdiL (CAAX protease family)